MTNDFIGILLILVLELDLEPLAHPNINKKIFR